MRAVLLALLVLTATTAFVVAEPAASAGCAINPNDVVGSVVWCADTAVCNVEHIVGLC
jgi:hypothetical protein